MNLLDGGEDIGELAFDIGARGMSLDNEMMLPEQLNSYWKKVN